MTSKTLAGCLVMAGLSTAFAGRAASQTAPAAAAVGLAPKSEARRTVRDVVLAVAHRQVHALADGEYKKGTWEEVKANRGPQGINWVYPWGVTLLGLLRTSDVTGDATFAQFVAKHNEIVARDWEYLRYVQDAFSPAQPSEVRALIQAAPIRRAMRVTSLDIAGAMSAQMVESFLRHGVTPTPQETALLTVTTDWVANKQSRLPDGTFWRPDSNQTLWIDDLFMSCSLLTRWYEYTKDRKYVDDAARQVIGMAARQQDKDGLWYHANFISENKTSPYKWGRANGWAMVATVEVLSVLPENHPDRPKLIEILRKHVAGIKPLQAPSGLWRQVLDHVELWEEMSCTSMFAYSIARAAQRGWIAREDIEIARKAFAGVSKNVSAQGDVAGTCEGTLIGRDLSYYANRQRPLNDQHAPGPVLLAGTELMAADQALSRDTRKK
jgi:rhamnogalacturonyl hydrolase YesR